MTWQTIMRHRWHVVRWILALRHIYAARRDFCRRLGIHTDALRGAKGMEPWRNTWVNTAQRRDLS
jgi:hypothetical protein